MTHPEYGRRIKSARKRAGLTQADLAQQLGMTQPMVTRWEKGHDIRAATLSRIAEICGCTVAYLVGEEDELPGGDEGAAEG